MAETEDVKLKVSADTSSAESELSSLGGKVDTFAKNSEKAFDGFKKAGAAVTGVAVAGAGVIALLGGAVAKMESMQVALKTAFGGDESSAKQAFDTISEFATKTPYQMEEVMSSFLKLKNMGLDPSIEALTSYGNTASSMGKGLNEMIEAVADAATGEFERLKEFGIKASKNGDEIKFTFKGVETSIKNDSESIQQYLLNIGNVDFAGGMEAQSQTLGGMFSTLKDNLFLFSAQLGEPLKAPLKELMGIFDEFSQKILKFVENNPELAKTGAYFLLIGTALAGVVGPMLLIIGLLPAIAAGFALVFSGVGLVAGAILALIAVGGYLLTHWDDLKEAVKVVWPVIKDMITSSLDFINSYLEMFIMDIKFKWHEFWTWVGAFLSEVWYNMTTSISTSLTSIKTFFMITWMGIKEFFFLMLTGMRDYVTTTFDSIVAIIISYYEAVKQAFQGMWDGAVSIVTGAVDTVVGTIKSMLNGIISMINKAISGINKLSAAASKVPGVSIPSIPSIPMLAEGGIVTRPTMAVIGEAGPEAVLPLSKMGGFGGGTTINFYGTVSSREVAEEYADIMVKSLMLSTKVV